MVNVPDKIVLTLLHAYSLYMCRRKTFYGVMSLRFPSDFDNCAKLKRKDEIYKNRVKIIYYVCNSNL